MIKGLILSNITVDKIHNQIQFKDNIGKTHTIGHHQTGFENCTIKHVVGSLDNIIGSPIVATDTKFVPTADPEVSYLEYTVTSEKDNVMFVWQYFRNSF